MFYDNTPMLATYRFELVLRGGPLKGHLHIHQGEVADEWWGIALIVDL